jgi:hypothetical protein
MSAILKPAPFVGIRSDLSNEAYHATSALGASGLKKLAKSPAHYWAAYLDPEREPSAPTPAMRAGTLAHCVVLEPHRLDERYVIKPEGHDGRTKEGKAWCAQMAGFEIVTADQLLTARRQAAALHALPDIAALLSSGRPEVSVFWIDPDTGVHCKCRPDLVHSTDGGDWLVDVKTTVDASPEGFPKQVAKLGYHIQAAHYSSGWTAATGRRVLGFVFACVESDYPHVAAAYTLDQVAMAEGADECRRLIDLYDECTRTNRWPGYGSEIKALSLPMWALSTEEVEVSYA